jgi:hypothetical protein
VVGVFQTRHSHVEAKKCYGSKINKDELIKVMIDLAESMREGDTIRCHLRIQRSGRIYNVISTHFRIQRYKLLVENNENKK